MTVRKDKPNSAEETARVLRIFDMLRSELEHRFPPVVVVTKDPFTFVPSDGWALVLEIADSIARRTDDD